MCIERTFLFPRLHRQREELLHHRHLHEEDERDDRDVAEAQDEEEAAEHRDRGAEARAERPPFRGLRCESGSLELII